MTDFISLTGFISLKSRHDLFAWMFLPSEHRIRRPSAGTLTPSWVNPYMGHPNYIGNRQKVLIQLSICGHPKIFKRSDWRHPLSGYGRNYIINELDGPTRETPKINCRHLYLAPAVHLPFHNILDFVTR